MPIDMSGSRRKDPPATHGRWADLLDPASTPYTADFTILGLPFDGAVSERKGSALGPDRMRFWSQHVTPYNEERRPLAGIKICDLGDMSIAHQAQDFNAIRAQVASLPSRLIALGGDHSVSIPVIAGQRERFSGRRLGLLWLDAHPDLCDEYLGSRLSHACVLRRAIDCGISPKDICMVGVRAWEKQEVDFLAANPVGMFTAADVSRRGATAIGEAVRKQLQVCDAVHISLDIDVLDPAAAPGTGIPEPGGLTTREVLTVIQAMNGLNLVGLDVVEVAPALDPSEATVFAGLKMITEFIGTAGPSSRS